MSKKSRHAAELFVRGSIAFFIKPGILDDPRFVFDTEFAA